MKVKARSSQALLLGATALVAVVGFTAIAVGAASDTQAAASVASTATVQASAESLTDEEIDGLMFMREEEKLAFDVYMTFADDHGLPIFSNIASAEDQHMTAVLGLIEAYGLDDPVDESPIGEFANEELQKLYDDLIKAGSVDPASALEVGAIIEEVDILDLERYLAGTTNADIIRVYENLLRGSENHLRAFVSQLESAGVDRDDPTHMDEDAYEAILESGMARGGSSGAGHSRAGHGEGECDESGERHREQGQHGRGQGTQGQGGPGQGGRSQHGRSG